MAEPAPFAPLPGETIQIGSRALRFDRDKAVEAFPTVFKDSSGRRAQIYRLYESSGRRFALKVFKPSFRDAGLPDAVQRLEAIGTLTGFRAAQRSVLRFGDPLVRRHPDLLYAMLMPWIDGTPWGAILARAGAGQVYLRPGMAVHLAWRFLGVMAGLEGRQAAHTDVSGGNVTLQERDLTIEMLDLEDLYVTGGEDCGNRGAPGYVHPAVPVLSCAEGDRYAAAVLAAEMLILGHPALAVLAGEDGYFQGNCVVAPGQERYRQAEPWLYAMAPEYAECFRLAWYSLTLQDCPAIAELHGAMAKARLQFRRGSGSLLIPLSPAGGASGAPKVIWTPLG